MNDKDQGSDPPLGEESPWEKAWTLDEMQKGASHWSLAGDAGMLHYLQEFSQKMISSTHKIQEQMNGLVHEAKLTGVRLDNTVNTFIMLANTQFVENRVYEEDIAQDETCAETTKTKKPELTKEERNAALIPRIKGAMSLGLAVLDAAFEKIYVNEVNSESEDEDSMNPSDAILEPKDPYLIRPLPYLIGTTAFLQSEGIGLVEEASDDEVSGHGSVSESESDASSSEEEEVQRQNGDAKVTSTRHHTSSSSSEAESESDGDLFGGNESDMEGEKELKDEGRSEVIDTQKTKVETKADFASELASRMRSSPPTVDNAPKTKKRSSYKEDPFAPPSLDGDEVEDDDSPFSRNAGLFSTGGGLFDDNEDEDGLFHDDPFVGNKKSTAGIVSQNRNSVADVGKKEHIAAGKKEEKEQGKSTVKKPAPRGLFDDDQDDDDLFAALAPKKTPVKPAAEKAAPPRAKSGLFADDDEEEDDMFAVTEQTTSSSKKRIPAGAVSMFGGAPNPLVAAIKAQKSPRSDTDEEQTWSDEGNQSSLSSASVSTNSATRSSLRKEHSPSASSNSLFAEEPEDLFSGSQEKRESLGKSSGGSGGALASSGAGGAGLFSDDEDLFASPSKPQVAAPSPARVRKSGLLFDVEDEDDDGDFLSAAAFKSSVSTKKVESDIFGGAEKTQVPETKPSEVPRKSPVTPRKTTLSLFEDDDDDLFAVTSPVTKPGATSSPGPKSTAQHWAGNKSLFQDEGDWLFGGADDNGPTVDLFGTKDTPKAKEVKTKATPPTSPKGTTTPSSYRDETVPAAAEDSTPTQEEEPDHIPVKPKKKLAGAVSMFGSIDPTMVGRKTTVGSPPLAAKPTLPKRPDAKSPSEEATMKVDGPSIATVKSDFESVRKSRTTSDIKTRQANLSLNPSALLPGASLPPRRAVAGAGGTLEEAASFDEPVKIPVLQSVSKDRARVQVKRRPPSRKNRLTRNDDTDDVGRINTEAEVESGHAPSTASAASSGDLSSPSEDKLTISNDVQKARLFSDDVDDVRVPDVVIGGDSRNRNLPFSGADDSIVTVSNVTPRSSVDTKDATERLFDDNDKSPTGFHSQDSKIDQSESSNIEQLHHSPAAETTTKVSVSSSDELFPTSHREGATRPTSKPTTDLFADSDDVGDIFGDKKKATIISVTPPIEGDDIFGSRFTNTSTMPAKSSDTVQTTSKPTTKVVPPGADEFDDIFGDMKVKDNKAPSKSTTHGKSPQSDEDDIFGAVSRSTVHHRLKKAVSRDEDIFADDTDIFADLATSKSKTKKAKAKTGPTKSLFSSNDIDDDIFADVSSKSKPKTKKSPKPSSAATKSASIFDEDSPSIFDDPLNALGH